ncbi:hypothetical protein B0T24DRAFT_703457 [Lasiosphaeria ovina]|uniref:Apple domain-containing protein n=1 Tax=Lasiosphaeria ovina TaxID=92902 RepID=A0AAE0KBF6_9PEZI|nr:hypothetical protein B0T24DRAFT_703457 [Lasiosphaeria ovina]
MHLTQFIAFGLPLVAASPVIPKPKPVDECKAVNIVVDVLKLNKATPFCSSFLSIKTSTATAYATVTSTSTKQVQGPTITSTDYLPPITATSVAGQLVTETTTVTGEAVSTISGVTTTTSTAWTTTTVYYSLGVNGRKRSPDADISALPIAPRGAPKLPPFVAAFASSAISKACSCLSIPTPVATVTLGTTATAIATATGPPVTVAVSLGTTTTLHSTSLSTSTATAHTTTTVLTTQYSTASAVVTSTATVSRLAVCSPGPNAPYNKPLGYPSRLDLDSSQHPTDLPDAQTCCESCYARQNCVAASFLASQGTCFFAIAVSSAGTSPAPPQLGDRCPLGVGGNGITSPGQGGSWFPGPCVN